ncbi:MAG: hypothetical protein ACOX6T_07165 [Myxococcales bacterium]|jgi:hypothetical protein
MAKQRSKRKKKSGSGGSGSAESSSGGGVMMSLRGGFKSVATGNTKKSKSPASKVWDIAFWVLLAAALIFFMARRF